jgi:hypothetical protein
MSARKGLAWRHPCTTFNIVVGTLAYTCTTAHDQSGTLLKIWLSNHKSGSCADIAAQDAAAAASLALEFGCPFQMLRQKAHRGGVLRAALDAIAEQDGAA